MVPIGAAQKVGKVRAQQSYVAVSPQLEFATIVARIARSAARGPGELRCLLPGIRRAGTRHPQQRPAVPGNLLRARQRGARLASLIEACLAGPLGLLDGLAP